MSKNLVIVESPSKAKTISKYLGKNYIVEATIGHIKDLPKSSFGIDVEDNFKPKLINIKGKSDVIKKIKSNAEKVQNIFLATDPDREGEAIAQDVYEIINKKDLPISRVLFNEITAKGIKLGMSNPRKIDLKLVDSQRARRVMDRIIGYKISPLLWNHLVSYSSESTLSAGRVQSVALKLICEREKDIRDFIAVEYWSIIGNFGFSAENEIHAKLVNFENKNYKIPESIELSEKDEFKNFYFYIKNSEEADWFSVETKKHNYIVSKLEKKNVNRYPNAPFITSTLQQEASKKLGLRPRQTMSLAQKLYEGIEIGGDGLVGLITYMRTDSTRLSEDSLVDCRKFINELFGNEYLPSEAKQYFKKKSNVQDAHEAIRPTDLKFTPQYVKRFLSKDLFNLYELIWLRFIASQMNPAQYEQTTLELAGGPFVFRATGQIPIFKGYLAVYDDQENENGDDEHEDENDLFPSELEEGKSINLYELYSKQHYTKPPFRFTESSLVKELDNLGIGRPSTYANIISTLYDRNYIGQIEKKLQPTELGEKVNELLVNHFDHIVNVKFTALMEKELDDVEEGENTYESVLKDFLHSFKENFDEVEKHFIKQKCEKCNSDMEIKVGRFGRFLACTNYPECKNIKSLKVSNKAANETLNEFCPKCKNQLVYRNSKYGRFIGCSNYPQCDYIKIQSINLKCPKCKEGEVVQKFTKTRKVFYGCSRYPKCDYANWDKPIDKLCPECKNNYLIEKNTRNEKRLLCNSCKYFEILEISELE